MTWEDAVSLWWYRRDALQLRIKSHRAVERGDPELAGWMRTRAIELDDKSRTIERKWGLRK